MYLCSAVAALPHKPGLSKLRTRRVQALAEETIQFLLFLQRQRLPLLCALFAPLNTIYTPACQTPALDFPSPLTILWPIFIPGCSIVLNIISANG
jgi:hypothetical protein